MSPCRSPADVSLKFGVYYSGAVHELVPDEWKDVLKVASILQTHNLYTQAMNKLDNIPFDPVSKAELAHLCDVKKWLRPAYEEICLRGPALEVEEALRIGWGSAYKLIKIREQKFLKSLTLCHTSNAETEPVCKASRTSDLVYPDRPDNEFQETLDASLFRAFKDISEHYLAALRGTFQ